MRTSVLLLAAGLLLAVASTATAWTGTYGDLISRPEYSASTSIALASSTYYTAGSPGTDGGIGYQLSDFQLNLVYQEIGSYSKAETRGLVEALDDWRYAPIGPHNFPDGEQYFLRIDAGGGLPIGLYTGTGQLYQSDSGQSWVKWTMSGWWDNEMQTILAGDIVGSDYLRVIGGYRSFGNEDFNEVEVFSGQKLACEVGGYTLNLTGLNLGVTLVPEPSAIVLLVTAGLGALCYVRCRRRS
jgi:hypothetical protein